MDWNRVAGLEPIRLNLGGYGDCHPAEHYEGFVAVDLIETSEWTVAHDLTQPFPLPDGSVTQILSEHCLEHLPEDQLPRLLDECHRVLRPGGWMRFAVPDYGAPRNARFRERGHDPGHLDHLNFPTYESLLAVVARSAFEKAEFHQYWSGGTFVDSSIEYDRGWVKRTKDNDHRNRRVGLRARVGGVVKDVACLVTTGFDRAALSTVRGRPLRMTSIVVDLAKPALAPPGPSPDPAEARMP